MNTTEARSGNAKWLVFLALAVVAVFGLRTISNGDFWMHLAQGREVATRGIPRADAFSFTAAGRPWVDASWLYDRVLFALWNIGKSPLVIVLHTAVLVLAFAQMIRVARRWAGDTSIALTVLLSAWLIAPRFTVGPGIAGLYAAALFVGVLSAERKPWVPWAVLVPAQLVWTNVHESFVLGPVLCAVFAVDAWVRSRGEGRGHAVRLTLLLAGATALVTLLNPYGAKLHAHVVAASASVASNFVQEWISPVSMQFRLSRYAKHLVTLVLLIGAGGLVAERRRLPVALTTLAVFGAFLVVRSLRHVGMFAVLSFPFLALSVAAIGGSLGTALQRWSKAASEALPPLARVLAAAGAAVSIVLVCSNLYYVSVGGVSSFGLGVEYDLFPQAAAEVINRPDFPARAINLPFDGGFLAWRCPGRKVFVDYRATLYGADFYAALSSALGGKDDAWNELEQSWQPGAVILNCCLQGAGVAVRELLKTGQWALAYFDGTTAILLKAVSENRALIQDRDIQAAGLEILEKERKHYAGKVGASAVPGVAPRLIGAGTVFLALGRHREARAVSSLLARGAPMCANAWFSLGVASAQLGDNEEAIRALSTACRLMPRSVYPWLYLSRAYTAANRADEARTAMDKARLIDVMATTAFNNPGAAAAIKKGGVKGAPPK